MTQGNPALSTELPINAAPARQRRSKLEVMARIHEAARRTFAERGYKGATTREIALRADASETLLFRYFGSKEALFDDTVSTPFNELMQNFLSTHSGASNSQSRRNYSRDFVTALVTLLSEHQELLTALISAPTQADEGPQAPLHGLDHYFNAAVAQLNRQLTAEGEKPDLNLDIGVRVGFGMVVSSLLLRGWLFPNGLPATPVLAEVLSQMLYKALGPAAPV